MSGKQHRFPLEDKGQIHGALDTPDTTDTSKAARALQKRRNYPEGVRYTVSKMGEDRFEFHQLPRDVEGEVKTQAREILELFEKWCVCEKTSRCEQSCKINYRIIKHRGLKGRMKFATFLYNKHFQVYQRDTFALV